MVLTNLFAGQQWRRRHRTDLLSWGPGGGGATKEEVGSTEREMEI